MSVDLETRLADAAAAAAWPPTPDLRAGVLARIVAPETPDLRGPVVARLDARGAGLAGDARPARAAAVRRRTLVRALALAAVLVLALAGVAGALGFRLPGFELFRVETTPPAGLGLGLGSPVPVADVIDGGPGGPDLRLPGALPAPDTAFRIATGEQSIVSVAWRATAGEPAIPGTDLSLVLMAVRGATQDALVRKMAGPGTTVEAVVVGEDPAWWISGAPHEVLIQRPDGSIDSLAPAVAGDTLVFARDGTLYRLESSLGQDRTLEVAASMP